MARKQAFTEDSFTNFLAKLGANTQNLQGYGYYSLSPFVSRQRTDLEAAYRSSWLVGQVVDTVAEDMTREGVTINSKLPPEDVKLIQSTFTDLSIWHELANTIKWARLYGGAIAVILTEGADYEKPLNVNAVGKGRFKGLVVFDRWMLDPSFGNLVTEIGPSMGKPKYYRILPGMPALSGVNVHYSRIIRFDGIELPYYQRLTENLWGLSVVERMYDRLMAFDSATQGASQLLHKAHLRTIQVKGFREALALGGATESAVVKQFNYIRLLQTIEGLTVLDGDDSFQVHPYSFSGISDVLMQFGEQISGATGIPLVRLFGQSPAGLSSTGESDLRNYYDHINKLQESQMRAPLVKLFDVIGRSVLGKALPKDFEFEFNSLWQLSDTEKGQIASTDATAIAAAYGAGLITKKIAMKELLQNSRITGRFTNITEEDIENAKEETPPAGEENPFASLPIGSESPGSLLPPSEKSIDDLKQELEALDIEGGGDEFADLKQKLDEIDVDREILDKPSAVDGARKFFKDGISKILKPLVGLALIYHWFKKDKQISTEERANRLLGRSPYSPGQDSIEKKPSKKEVLLSIQKELKNIRSTFDAHLRAPKGGVSIKGKEFKGGEFIPSEGGYAEEYEKMQKEGKNEPSEEPKEDKQSGIQEAFKKKHPNVSGTEAKYEGLTKELALKKVKELRDKNIFATIWHQEGPKSGDKSKYFVGVPKSKESEPAKTNKEENKTGISTESPEFKAWFKGSKVVNENGDPLVVYHGTSKEFSEFSKEKIGSNLDTGDWGKGFYFGDKPKAEEYGKRSANPETWKTKPFYIDIKNPLVLSGSRKEEILTPDHPWTSVLKKMFGKEIIDRAIEDELDIPSLIRGEIGSDKFTETLKENGYDGVIRKYKEGSYEIIPFDPEQIKSVESKKGKEFKGGEFIPSEGGYAEEYEKMQKEGKSGSSEEPKEEKSPEKKTDKKEKEEKPKKEKKPTINYPEPKRSKMEASFIGTKRLPPTKVLNKKGEEVEKPGALVMENGKPLPKHVAHIAIPPAWQHVRINPDPKGEALVAGTDQKGHRQVKYSESHDERVSIVKFGKVRKLNANIDKVIKNIEKNYNGANKEQALCLRLIEQTGARADTGNNEGEVKTYGASSLQNKHIKVNEDGSVAVEFIGKHGKVNNYKVKDPTLTKILKQRAARPDKEQKVFDTDYRKLKKFSKAVSNNTPKAFRTRVGTNRAKEAVAKMPVPKTEKELTKAKLAVAEAVSEYLCNTRKVCLDKYIDPIVFDVWKIKGE